MSRFILLPIDTAENPISIKLPSNLIPQSKANNPKILASLLKACAKADITKSDCGRVSCKDEIINVKFDEFINDCVNMKFDSNLEPVYAMLYENGFMS